jgi:hypothetical protein
MTVPTFSQSRFRRRQALRTANRGEVTQVGRQINFFMSDEDESELWATAQEAPMYRDDPVDMSIRRTTRDRMGIETVGGSPRLFEYASRKSRMNQKES